MSVVQIYYRCNHHWYLKQQWTEVGIRCLGFHPESGGAGDCVTLLLSHKVPSFHPSQSHGQNELGGDKEPLIGCVRQVSLVWETCYSYDTLCTAAVIDGATLLLTPLGRAVVPPPMSMYQVALPAPGKSVSFSASTGADSCSWSLACLCDRQWMHVCWGDTAGQPQHSVSINLREQLCAVDTAGLFFRSVAIQSIDRGVMIAVVGTRSNSLQSDVQDEVFIMHVVDDHVVGATTQNIAGNIYRSSFWSASPTESRVSCPKLSLAINQHHGGFEILTYKLYLNSNSDSTDPSVISMELMSNIVCLPEPCCHIILVQLTSTYRVRMEEGLTHIDSMVGNDDDIDGVVVGLSSKGRLYCGEVLLASGINSVAVNECMDLLLCVSSGTKPVLRYFALSALSAPDSMGDIGEQESTWEVEVPRPVSCRYF